MRVRTERLGTVRVHEVVGVLVPVQMQQWRREHSGPQGQQNLDGDESAHGKGYCSVPGLSGNLQILIDPRTLAMHMSAQIGPVKPKI